MPAFTRRTVLATAALSAVTATSSLLAACASQTPGNTTPDEATPPIVFVHGNGDTAALWMTTLWRFESNGWPRDRLFALGMPYPLARDDDTRPQPGRSSAAESMATLASEVDRVRRQTGANKVVLVANSRGGNAVRNYIANGGGAASVSRAILGGTPNHGVWADPNRTPGNEFNGAGPFLSALNAPQGPNGDEVTPGVKWMTIRSDKNDKYAQPDGIWIGSKGVPTNVAFDGPALKGAENIVIAGIDHRETAFSAPAFAAMYRFITGKPPTTTEVVAEARIVLDGTVSGYGVDNVVGAAPSNLPLVGATVEVYATNLTDGTRLGPAKLTKTIGADGSWGPLDADPKQTYEFVIAAPGYAITHLYRSPFPRSSNIVDLRAEHIPEADKATAAIVTLTRPRGYFGLPRDTVSLDGISPPPGLVAGVAGVSSSKLRLTDAASRAVVGIFDGERIVGRVWPEANNELTVLEVTQ